MSPSSAPLYYWSQNVGGLQVLLEEMVAAGTTQMVFSSSAAVYGQPDLTPGAPGISGDGRILESAPRMPMNPYGATKLAGEHMMAATARAHQWHAMSLRYFNVAGAAQPGARRPRGAEPDPHGPRGPRERPAAQGVRR